MPVALRDQLAPWPRYAPDEIDAVARVLRAGQGNYSYGAEGPAFEREFAAWCGARHALALANGTVALELALRGLGIGAGDEVVVTPRSFVASASAPLLVGARPVFADVDPDSQNLTPDSIRAVLTPRTRAVIVVHLAGWPCDMDGIMALAAERGIAVIEDCAQAHGAEWRGRRVGGFGDAAVFSFCHDKIISTGGEGGMLLTARDEVRERVDAWRRHGRDAKAAAGGAPWQYHFIYAGPGSNQRLSEMQSAIGRVQLGKVERWLAQRRANAAHYAAGLGAISGLRCAAPGPDALHAWYKYYVYVRPERLRAGWDRDRILAAAWTRGLPCWQGSCGELYREQVFVAAGAVPAAPLPAAQALARSALMLPLHPGITPEQIDEICSGIGEIMAEAVK